MTYIDTSALIAFADASDTFHPLFRRLFSSPPDQIFTTSLVVAEGHAWFLRRFDSGRGLQFMTLLEDMQFIKVEGPGLSDVTSATAILRKFSDQNLTLTDAIGLHLMEHRKVRSCWSTDRDLGLTGVPLIIHTA